MISEPRERLDAATFRGVHELVVAELRERIVSGELASGKPLRQRELALDLGVSREPIKHAMRVLEEEGLIVRPPRRSAIVAPVTRKVVLDVYEVRAALDAVAARRAASLHIKARRGICEVLDTVIREASEQEAGDRRRLTGLDRRFHLGIYEAAGNDVATAFFRTRSVVIARVMSLVASTELSIRAWEEHGRISTAIGAGDAKEAARLAEAHGLDAAAWLLSNVPAIKADDPADTESETSTRS